MRFLERKSRLLQRHRSVHRPARNATVNSASSITTSGLETITDFGLTYSNFSFYAGSGGGISLVEAEPSYQVGVVPTALATTLNEASGYTVTPLGGGDYLVRIRHLSGKQIRVTG